MVQPGERSLRSNACACFLGRSLQMVCTTVTRAGASAHAVQACTSVTGWPSACAGGAERHLGAVAETYGRERRQATHAEQVCVTGAPRWRLPSEATVWQWGLTAS